MAKDGGRIEIVASPYLQQAAAAALTPEQLQAIAEAQAQAAQAQQDAAAGN